MENDTENVEKNISDAKSLQASRARYISGTGLVGFSVMPYALLFFALASIRFRIGG